MAFGVKTGGGSRKGKPNKATIEIKDLARKHGPAAIKKLADLMIGGTTEQVQAFAAEKLLDRGYGKAAQAHVGPDGEGPIQFGRVELVILDPHAKN